MGEAFIPGRMDASMRASTLRIRSREMGFIHIRMGRSIMASGVRASSMVKGLCISRRRGRRGVVSGLRGSCRSGFKIS